MSEPRLNRAMRRAVKSNRENPKGPGRPTGIEPAFVPGKMTKIHGMNAVARTNSNSEKPDQR